MATSARVDRAWTLLAALAIAILGATARDVLQTDALADVETLGPFDAAAPGDCAQLCTEQEECKGYRWRGGMCNLTVAGDSSALTVTMTPSGNQTEATDAPEPTPAPVPAAPEPVKAPASPDLEETTANDTVPMTMEEIVAFITECRNTGSLASSAAAIAACQVVTNDCPVPPADASDNVVALRLDDDPPLPAVEQLRAALDEACKRETIETCKREAFPSAEVLVTDCVRILNRGPDVSVVGCEDTKVANQIFTDEVDKICEG